MGERERETMTFGHVAVRYNNPCGHAAEKERERERQWPEWTRGRKESGSVVGGRDENLHPNRGKENDFCILVCAWTLDFGLWNPTTHGGRVTAVWIKEYQNLTPLPPSFVFYPPIHRFRWCIVLHIVQKKKKRN